MNLAEQLSGPVTETPTLLVNTEASNIISLADEGLVPQIPTSREMLEDFTDHIHSPLNEW